MENATKALLIAGGILIAIIIISIAVYLYSMYSNQSEEYSATISAIELEKFNSKFDVYVDRTDISAQELVSVVNLAKEYDYQIKIYLKTSSGTRLLQFSEEDTPEKFIKDNQDTTFSCKLNITEASANPKYDTNGKITKLTFTDNT